MHLAPRWSPATNWRGSRRRRDRSDSAQNQAGWWGRGTGEMRRATAWRLSVELPHTQVLLNDPLQAGLQLPRGIVYRHSQERGVVGREGHQEDPATDDLPSAGCTQHSDLRWIGIGVKEPIQPAGDRPHACGIRQPQDDKEIHEDLAYLPALLRHSP